MQTNLSAMFCLCLLACGLLLGGCGPGSGGGGDDSSSSSDAGTSDGFSDGSGDGSGDSSTSTTSDGSAPPTISVEWGSLKGRFVYDGAAPTQGPVDMRDNRDAPYCGKFKPLNEELVVNAENGGVRDVVVFLLNDTDKIHPDYEATAADVVPLNNEHCRFDPHIRLLRTTQTLGIGNAADVGHNTKIDPFDNAPFNQVIPAKAPTPTLVEFPKQELRATKVSCSIHPWMNAYLVIRNNPYFAVTDENGNFEIKNLPGGVWSMQVWHPKAGYISEVSIGGETVSWSRGRADAVIADGDADWGEVKLSPDLFMK